MPILFYHNQPTNGTKDELVLNVCLLKANREHCISKNKALALLELIKTTSVLICRERRSLANQSSRKSRKFASPMDSHLSIKDPRKNASEASTYVRSRIDIPTGIDERNIETLFEPLKQDLLAISRSADDEDVCNDENEEESDVMERNVYESFFEIGVRVEIQRSKEETKCGKRGGWFVAVVQNFDLENDWIKVEFLSHEETIFKFHVSELLEANKLRLKNSLF